MKTFGNLNEHFSGNLGIFFAVDIYKCQQVQHVEDYTEKSAKDRCAVENALATLTNAKK